jgi:hypothetical protein
MTVTGLVFSLFVLWHGQFVVIVPEMSRNGCREAVKILEAAQVKAGCKLEGIRI